MHWTLARLLRLYPKISLARTIAERLDAHLAPQTIEVEVRYFAGAPTFERPYGYAWVLKLAAEISDWKDPEAQKWAANFAPKLGYALGMTSDTDFEGIVRAYIADDMPRPPN